VVGVGAARKNRCKGGSRIGEGGIVTGRKGSKLERVPAQRVPN